MANALFNENKILLQLWGRTCRRNSSLQAVWDTPMSRVTGCVRPLMKEINATQHRYNLRRSFETLGKTTQHKKIGDQRRSPESFSLAQIQQSSAVFRNGGMRCNRCTYYWTTRNFQHSSDIVCPNKRRCAGQKGLYNIFFILRSPCHGRRTIGS